MDGQAGPNTRPARWIAELDRTYDQLGHPPSWTSQVWRMAELDRTRDQLSHPPSWDDRVVLVLSAMLLSQDCIELALISYRSKLPLELYNKNRENSSSRIKFRVFV
ncbi:hypothetical protein HID58_048118 [Brassica napus]|uniref:Uncharacterized protein n=1 Tax=Brassica napus TaxID=3708 RepID=A0ABQ8B169_BRANA|nr:hypothetical protein HID58_048118 [Brassica napus]